VNSRLDELQAAILRVKLRHLDAQNERRRTIACAYTAALPPHLAGPAVRPDASHVFHLYVTRSPARDAVQADLRGLGVGTGIHYPAPVHLQPAYKGRVRLWDGCRNAEQAAAEVLSLPLYPELTDDQVQTVCQALRHLGTTD